MTDTKKGFGNKVGYQIFRWTISLFGVGPAYFILHFPIAYYVLCRPSARRVASYYLRHRFPNRPWWKMLWYTYIYYYRFGQSLIDQAALSILGVNKFKIEFTGAEEVLQLAQEGRGIVLLTSHIGVWQQAVSTLGFIGKSTYLNIRREYHSQTMGLDHFLDSGVDIHIISPDSFLGGVPQLSAALLKGHLVAVMGDRTYGEGTCAKTTFLDEEALFPLLPHHLALSTGSDMIVFLTSRIGKKHFHFEAKVNKISDEIRALGKTAGRIHLLRWYVDILENYVAQHPFMWYNFLDFWKK